MTRSPNSRAPNSRSPTILSAANPLPTNPSRPCSRTGSRSRRSAAPPRLAPSERGAPPLRRRPFPRAVHDVQQQAAGNRIGGDEAHFQRHAEPEGLAAAAAAEFMAGRIVVVEIGRQGRYRQEPVRTHVGAPYEQPAARHAGDTAREPNGREKDS